MGRFDEAVSAVGSSIFIDTRLASFIGRGEAKGMDFSTYIIVFALLIAWGLGVGKDYNNSSGLLNRLWPGPISQLLNSATFDSVTRQVAAL